MLIIKNNRPQHVGLSEERYQQMLEAEQSAAVESLHTSLEDFKAGRIKRYSDADSLIQALEHDEKQCVLDGLQLVTLSVEPENFFANTLI